VLSLVWELRQLSAVIAFVVAVYLKGDFED
jgi:hypothetical protein